MESKEYLGYKLHIFPFEQVDKGEDIVLYGFGRVGQQYYWQVKSNNYCRIRCIVDRNYKDIKFKDIDVVSPEFLEGGGVTARLLCLFKTAEMI